MRGTNAAVGDGVTDVTVGESGPELRKAEHRVEISKNESELCRWRHRPGHACWRGQHPENGHGDPQED